MNVDEDLLTRHLHAVHTFGPLQDYVRCTFCSVRASELRKAIEAAEA